jgi:hypothetical protein
MAWFGDVSFIVIYDIEDVTRREMNMNMENGEKEVDLRKDRLTVWGMREMGVRDDMMSDNREWKKSTCYTFP